MRRTDQTNQAVQYYENFDYDDDDQPRARAHSTGAGSEPSRGSELALSSLARQARDTKSAATRPAATSSEAVLISAHNTSLSRRDMTYVGQQQQQTCAGSEAHQSWLDEPRKSVQISSGASQPIDDVKISHPKSDEHNDEFVNIEEDNQRALFLLRKNSFNCTLVGARQTGKRTIVKCFVKLLNEFKLAADEYKKEKMLSKLVECSERLQELTSQQEQAAEDAGAMERTCGRSRLNSWLGGATMNKLLNLSPKSKRRLNSVVGLWSPGAREGAPSGAGGQQQQRRHTTIEPPSVQGPGPTATRSAPGASHASGADQTSGAAGSSRYLNVYDSRQATHLVSCCNKSDTNVNYTVNQPTTTTTSVRQTRQSQDDGVTTHQLKVPAFDSVQLRKHSDPLGSFGPSSPTTASGSQQHLAAASRAARRHTSANFVSANEEPAQQQASPIARARKQSVALSRRRQRMLLSLKELNRRRCGIKFKTRRQISQSCLEQLKRPVVDGIRRRASTTNGRSSLMQADLPDSFLVVYSINDR